MTAATTTSTAKADCGCGCGGASKRPSAFVRPRFFAGQLLTEDDLGLLVEAARKGSLCSRVFLDSEKFEWR